MDARQWQSTRRLLRLWLGWQLFPDDDVLICGLFVADLRRKVAWYFAFFCKNRASTFTLVSPTRRRPKQTHYWKYSMNRFSPRFLRTRAIQQTHMTMWRRNLVKIVELTLNLILSTKYEIEVWTVNCELWTVNCVKVDNIKEITLEIAHFTLEIAHFKMDRNRWL